MKVLQVHNIYQQPGGEDQVYAAEHNLLTHYGHTVEQYAVHNDRVNQMSGLGAATRAIWNSRTVSDARPLIRRFQPDVVHCHNTFPLISPAIYYAGTAEHVPVVQTLHNYRLICPAATLHRDGHVCEDCVHHFAPYPAVLHNCYRGSKSASLAVASMLAIHRAVGTYRSRVACFIALTRFGKQKLIEGGLPPEKIAVKPNFIFESIAPGSGHEGFALYVGRLVEEKGVRTLLAAWKLLSGVPLRIVGDGPLREFVESAVRSNAAVTYHGFRPRDEVLETIRAAACIIIPSEWYEGQSMTALEAMACGTPLVASDLGSLPEVAIEGVTGVRFPPGNVEKLASAVRRLFSDREALATLRTRTRAYYETNFTPEANYRQLIAIYREVSTGLNA